MWYLVRLVDSMGMDLPLCFFCHEISSLVKSNIMWDTMLVNKALCESKDNGMGRNREDREEKSIL